MVSGGSLTAALRPMPIATWRPLHAQARRSRSRVSRKQGASSKAARPGRGLTRARGRLRRTAARTAEAPTSPPIRNERSRARLRLPVHAAIVGSARDLHPRRPAARRDRAGAAAACARSRQPGRDAARHRRPGGERRGLGRRARRASARCVAKQADDEAGALARSLLDAARASSWSGRSCRGRTGIVVALVGAGRRAVDGDRPRRLAGAARRRARARRGSTTAPGCTSPATACSPSRSRRRRSHAARWRVHGDASSERGPLVVERDPRVRAGAASERTSMTRARRRLRERARVGDGRRRVRAWPRRRWSSAARAASRCSAPDGVRGAPAARADVVDTTGAGDALAAGFLVGGIELGARGRRRAASAQLGAVP